MTILAHDDLQPGAHDVTPDSERATERSLGWGFWLCIAWLVVIVLAAILAPYLGLKDPDTAIADFPDLVPIEPTLEAAVGFLGW